MMTFTFRPSKTSGYGPRLTNAGVAKAFAAGETTGHSKHMFIRCETVFSYGTHFPVARRFRSVILWNPARYSVTTSGHQGQVSYALQCAGAVLVDVDACDPERVVEQWKTNAVNIVAALKKIDRARVERWREVRMRELDDLKRQQNYLLPLVAEHAAKLAERLETVQEAANKAEKYRGEAAYYEDRVKDLEGQLNSTKAAVVAEVGAVGQRLLA